MLTLTIKAMLEEKQIDTGDHWPYVYRDGDTIFYVGKSYHPIERGLAHLGLVGRQGTDGLGNMIKNNLPQSLEWTVDLYTLFDCEPFITTALFSEKQIGKYRRLLARLEADEAWSADMGVNMAERALIYHFHPYLNVQCALYYDVEIPDRYLAEERRQNRQARAWMRKHMPGYGTIPKEWTR